MHETDETNNARYDVVKIGPDLYISVLTGPTTAARGATIVVNATVRNRGVSGAPASTTYYYLSTTKTAPPPGGTDSTPLLATSNVQALAAGAQFPDSQQVTLPAGIGGGTFYLLVIADGNNEINELQGLETNNLKYLTVVIP